MLPLHLLFIHLQQEAISHVSLENFLHRLSISNIVLVSSSLHTTDGLKLSKLGVNVSMVTTFSIYLSLGRGSVKVIPKIPNNVNKKNITITTVKILGPFYLKNLVNSCIYIL